MVYLYPTVIQQGATWQRTFKLTDSDGVAINLTNCSAKMQFRPSPDSAVVIAQPALTIDAVAGTITATLVYDALVNTDLSAIQTGTVTEMFSTPLGNVPYRATGPIVYADLEVTFSDGLTVARPVEIIACISKEVTHA